jgi:hypothetical protein
MIKKLMREKLRWQALSVLVIVLFSAMIYLIHNLFVCEVQVFNIIGWAFSIITIMYTFGLGYEIISQIERVNSKISQLEKKLGEGEQDSE